MEHEAMQQHLNPELIEDIRRTIAVHLKELYRIFDMGR
jgi:ribosomal protein L29